MKPKLVVEFLDWIVAMNLQFYKTEETNDYKPNGASHFYLYGSPERFSSEELYLIFTNKAKKKLSQRWTWALTDKKK